MTIGVAKEDLEGEARVGLHPENVGKLIKKGAKVVVQKSAGDGSGYSDAMYTAAGATIADEGAIWKSEVSNLVLELDLCMSSLTFPRIPMLSITPIISITPRGPTTSTTSRILRSRIAPTTSIDPTNPTTPTTPGILLMYNMYTPNGPFDPNPFESLES
jgi:hypothetical protein